ncbi:MAG: Rne/Rng family ribonuclease [Pseudomonadota bacterium]
MAKKMLIDATHAEETRVVVVDGNKVEEFDFESENKRQLAGNIYLAKVTRVEPSLQAAFVDYGGNRHGFLAFSEIHPDYYQIPVADREALLAEERAYAASLHEDDGEETPPKPKNRRSRSRRSRSDNAAVTAAEAPAAEAENALPIEGVERSEPETADPVVAIPGMDVVDLAPEADPEQSLAEDIQSAPKPEPVSNAEQTATDLGAETDSRAETDTPEAAAIEEPEESAPAKDEAPQPEGEETTVEPAEVASDELAPTEETTVEATDASPVAEAPANEADAADPSSIANSDTETPTEDEETPRPPSSIAATEKLGDEDAVITSDDPKSEEPDETSKDSSGAQDRVEETESVKTDETVDAALETPVASEAEAITETEASEVATAEVTEAASPSEDAPSDEPEAEDTAAEDDAEEEEETEASAEEQADEDTSGDDDDEAPEDTSDDQGTIEIDEDDHIEAVADDDTAEEIRPPRKPRPRRYKIQEVIKVRQIMLVQVVKEERGNKGAAITTYLSLAGRYCVLMPNTARGGGISRKITNAADRKKLKQIAAEIDVPDGAGLIIRTAGAKRTKSEIKRDYEYLQRLWEQIRELTLQSIAPTKIYEEGDLIKRSIRDLYTREIEEVLVEGEGGYRTAKDFMKMIMPSHAKNVQQYTDPLPLFARYQVESYLGAMFNPTVKLKSGGYIVIGVTEALVAIDVNSGKATKEGSIEQTALNTNLEAAEEIARQLRLRDLAGLIVIDFIDMEERKNNAAVEKRFKEKLKNDRARIQIGRISGFGLLEMSRQRLRPGMIEITTQPCPHCHGTGLIRSDDNLALNILREVEEEGVRRRSREVLCSVPIGIANFLMNNKREHVAQIEERYGLSIRIEADPHMISPDFNIERFKTATRKVPEAAPVVSLDTTEMMPELEEVEQEEPDVAELAPSPAADSEEGQGGGRKRRRRRRRRKSGGNGEGEGTTFENGESDKQTADATDETDDAAVADAEPNTEPSEDAPQKRRRSRGGRGRRKSAETAPTDAAPAEAEETQTPAEEPALQEAEVSSEAAIVSSDTPLVDGSETPTGSAADLVAPVSVEAPSASNMPAAASPMPELVTPDVTISQDDIPAPAEAVTVEVPDQEKPAAQEAKAPPPPEAEPVLAEPEPVVEEVAPEPPKPKRRGWWSMGG